MKGYKPCNKAKSKAQTYRKQVEGQRGRTNHDRKKLETAPQ